jgi:hypothetical protein
MHDLKVTQVFPTRKHVPLEGLYLGQNLLALAQQMGRSLVLADFLTDKNGVIAKAVRPGQFQVPVALRNASDWRLFQELMAQANVIVSTGAYFKRLATPGNAPQDILYQFEAGGAFATLGAWRLGAGYDRRSPDLAVVSRHLDFALPDALIRGGRSITVLTTDAMAKSGRARALERAHTRVIGCGETGVDGDALVTTLADELGHRVVMMAGGPSVLALLLAAQRLDLLYITQAQREIPFDDPATVQTMLPAAGQAHALEAFSLAHEYHQADVVVDDGSRMTQRYLRYDRRGLGQQG